MHTLQQSTKCRTFRFSADKCRAIGERLHETGFGPGKNRGGDFNVCRRLDALVERESPGYRGARIGTIGTKRSSSYRSIQQFAQLAMTLGNFLQRGFDRTSDIEPRALGGRPNTSVSPSQTDSASDLAMEKINFRLNLSAALLVTALAKVFEFLAQLDESALIFLLGFGIEHLARIAESTDADGCSAKQRSLVRSPDFGSGACTSAAQEIQRMEFFARMLQQALNVAETLDVLQRECAVPTAQGPILATAREYSRLPDGCWLRSGMASTLG